jgi:hypothetical protein
MQIALDNRSSKNVCILAIVVAELELGNVERHVLGAHLVERAHHAALEDRPEAFDGLCMNRADNILSLGMINGSRAGNLLQGRCSQPIDRCRADLPCPIQLPARKLEAYWI